MEKETFLQEYKGVLVAGIAVLVLGIILLFNFLLSGKEIILKPGAAMLETTEIYEIKWTSRNIDRVGIALFSGSKAQWIVQNYPASAGKYAWQPDPYQLAGTDYRIAIFAYPWKNGNPIDYSATPITIVGQKYISCEDYSVEQNWPYVANDYAGALKTFITSGEYSGDMGGLEGADANCQKEAQKNGYEGKFIALLGSDEQSARERIAKDGVFIEAEAAGKLSEGRTCHRFIAGDIQKLLDKTKLTKEIAQIELSQNFYRRLGEVWLGRITSNIKTKCLLLPKKTTPAAFSNTYTCQNWSISKRQIYSANLPEKASLTKCYDAEGKNLTANYVGAAAMGVDDQTGDYIITADTCDNDRRLICVEQ